MFCRNCGNEIGETAACCTKCGVANGDGDKFCPNCGVETTANQAICSKCGVRLNKKKVSGGLGGMKAKKPFKRKAEKYSEHTDNEKKSHSRRNGDYQNVFVYARNILRKHLQIGFCNGYYNADNKTHGKYQPQPT